MRNISIFILFVSHLPTVQLPENYHVDLLSGTLAKTPGLFPAIGKVMDGQIPQNISTKQYESANSDILLRKLFSKPPSLAFHSLNTLLGHPLCIGAYQNTKLESKAQFKNTR